MLRNFVDTRLNALGAVPTSQGTCGLQCRTSASGGGQEGFSSPGLLHSGAAVAGWRLILHAVLLLTGYDVVSIVQPILLCSPSDLDYNA